MWRSTRDRMESASPTASASTNRGGRPKDWTEPRTRRLIRLYLFTTLPLPKILELLEEDEFKPGKDAANKVKNSVLGNDARWIRPRDDEEERTRVRGLRNSLRGRRRPQDTATQDARVTTFGTSPGNASLGGTTLSHSYRSLVEESYATGPQSFAYPTTFNTDMPVAAPNDFTSSRFMPSFSWRNTPRQDTGLTTSTDISISSVFREKLSFLSLDKAKRAVKVLKRYTFPKNLEAQRTPGVPSDLLHDPDFYSPANRINDPFTATCAVPGDFLNTELFANRQQCAAGAPAHAAGACWCKVADQVYHVQMDWAMTPRPLDISDPNLSKKDIFGNTIFHHLAATEGIQEHFLHLVCLSLRRSGLPICDSNTAGQTFLHVLHRSWFQEGSRLNDLLEVLQTGSFDLFAADVYGRSFFHILRANGRSSVRFLGHRFDFARVNCRDAFGMKPMDARSSPEADYPAAYAQAQRARMATPAAPTRPVPRINTQTRAVEDKELSAHADLLRLILGAVKVEDIPFLNVPREDSQGRNAFHCLAEVDFCLSPDTSKHGSRGHAKDDPRSHPAGHHKRKHVEDEEADTPQTTSDSQRLKCIQSLVHAGVDANQYDNWGNTPLMSFVIHSGDATKYEKDESEKVIKDLVQKAGAKLESRNRNGETALHLAARHGKTIALRVLLELGANPHTRNAQGLSILEVVDNLYVTTECDDKNNARFEASRAILTRTAGYAIQQPSLIDEWARR